MLEETIAKHNSSKKRTLLVELDLEFVVNDCYFDNLILSAGTRSAKIDIFKNVGNLFIFLIYISISTRFYVLIYPSLSFTNNRF